MNNSYTFLIFKEKTNMGKLYNAILGKASGKVGDVVFRIVDGKVYIASHIGSNKISKSPECVSNRKKFASVLNFASAVNRIPDLKIIWNKVRKTTKSGYNKIISMNTKAVVNCQISKQNIITPDGFGLSNINAFISKESVEVSFKLSEDSSKYANEKFSACFVFACSEPISKKYKQSQSICTFVPDVVVSGSSPAVVSLYFNKNFKSVFKMYNNTILFFALTNTKHNNPLYSQSHAFEFSLKKSK